MTPTGTPSGSFFSELTRRFDGSAILGYLNFSDGRIDLKFRRAITEVHNHLLGERVQQPWDSLRQWLLHRAEDLEQSGSSAFKDLSAAKKATNLGLQAVLQVYRQHHADLLGHQPDELLFTPLFLARCLEAALSHPEPTAAVQSLNDFVGYRPIAILETRPQTEFYPHEKVAPVPLYWRGVDTPAGKYADVLRAGLLLLEQTDPKHLEEASLDPANIEELGLDPRAVDHFHPVNKRPSVLFGEWDPHRIDQRGFYRRFVLRQSTLDALVRWATTPERLFESGAALCGTILMGAGVSGWGPSAHDSTVTLSTLVQRIARYRDDFYKKLLQNVPGVTGDRLRAEADKLKQPFAAVRQYLNQTIASERALHLQERRLALLFAAMGYPNAARSRAANIPAPATRLAAEMRLRQTEASFAIPTGRLAEAAKLLHEVEDLLRRGINCGALIDPWNILGFQGLYPIFTGREDTVRDPRAEELILLVGRQFDLYAQGLSAAAASQQSALELQFRHGMSQLVTWWDVYASSTVTDMPRLVGQERSQSAEHVARAMTLWKSGGATDLAFWRGHQEGFRTPAAFAQVIDALIRQGDYRAAQALLITWLSVADTVPLQDPGVSFFRLSYRWLSEVINRESLSPMDRADLIRRFFELLEANADDLATVPHLGLGGADEADDENQNDEDEDDNPYESAYEGMSYRDSADDGEEGSVADGSQTGITGDFALDSEADRTEARLQFLAGIARHWRAAALPYLFHKQDERAMAAVTEWLRTARNHAAQLRQLAERLHAITIPEPTGGLESMMEFDRRRAVKNEVLEGAIQTLVEMTAAARALAALLPRTPELPGAQAVGATAQLAIWEPAAIRLERAIASADRGAARRILPTFIAGFRDEPLLVCPPSDGGLPGQTIRAQTALQIMESLLRRLPRLGLLRETHQLTRLARIMERNAPPSGRRVSSFDQLFRSGLTGVADALLLAARDWGEEVAEDGPLATALRQVGESFQTLWIDHSQGLRLSILEAVLEDEDWDELRKFIRQYGGELFTVRFLTMSNIRGILGQGIANWLDHEAIADGEIPSSLAQEWGEGKLDKPRIARQCEIVLQAIIEHYDEYRDYNTTTTQSDYGDNLYILLDFLRLKVQYERISWQLRPAILIHEVLCQRGFDRLAGKWREELAERTRESAERLLQTLQARETEHALKLRTIRDRLEERFVHPLQIDRAAARMARAASAARQGQPEDNPSFTGLLSAVLPLAEHPAGVGLDVPAWLRRLEEELRKSRPEIETDEEPLGPFVPIDFDDVLDQLKNWDNPIGD